MARMTQQLEVGAGMGRAEDAAAGGARLQVSRGLLLTEACWVVAAVRTDAVVRDGETEDRCEEREESDGEDGESQALESRNWSTASKAVSSKTRVAESGARNPVKSPKSKPSLSPLEISFPSSSPTPGMKSWVGIWKEAKMS